MREAGSQPPARYLKGESKMTVKLKGKNGRLDITEKNVELVTVTDMHIKINYKKPYKWGIVSGVGYYTDEYELVSCDARR